MWEPKHDAQVLNYFLANIRPGEPRRCKMTRGQCNLFLWEQVLHDLQFSLYLLKTPGTSGVGWEGGHRGSTGVVYQKDGPQWC